MSGMFPARITRLGELAHNLWWSWNHEAQSLFTMLDTRLWERTHHNPVKFLRTLLPQRLQAAAQDQVFLRLYDKVLRDFDLYMQNGNKCWYPGTFPDLQNETIAYFSAEFGLHECLPIYSGGLGILSGDHCKEASDLALPFIGVGFLYPQGYFHQYISPDGWQTAAYPRLDLSSVPAIPARTPDGKEIIIHVELNGQVVHAKIWRIKVGRTTLLLMDTDVESNAPELRDLFGKLYGGDQRVRISQEIVLGIGGVRALRALNINPTAWHMNEGHCAFLVLERAREMIQEGANFAEALEAIRADTVFTTHTPVAAGHDEFPFPLMDEYFFHFREQLGLDREEFLSLARHDQPWGPTFSMTILALRMSGQHNGVSKLHGEVSRKMWSFLWPEKPASETPISHITNGIHTPTWLAPELVQLYGSYLETDWIERIDDPQTWVGIKDIPDELLWNTHQHLKRELLDFIRRGRQEEWSHRESSSSQVLASGTLLDPDILTIGFARRFATYKRATLIFRDANRLKHILSNSERPVQIIFAGKAHPQDEGGKRLIQEIYGFAQDPGFAGRIAFVDNYDIALGRHLVQGVDVWLNNPRPPREASGTSGQKAALNGVLNLSILDGWWCEGYNGHNGWGFGQDREYLSEDAQDEADSMALYTLLEEEVIPLYYAQNFSGYSHAWVARMKEAICSIAPQFSTTRMIKEYTTRLYVPAMLRKGWE